MTSAAPTHTKEIQQIKNFPYISGMRQACYILIFLITVKGYSQDFALKDYYLIDSLKLTDLAENDTSILESALRKYHAAQSDTGRINALTSICEDMMHDSWMDYQFYQHNLINQAMDAHPSEGELKSLMNSLAISLINIGYIYKVRGDIEAALKYYHRALDLQREVGDQSRLAQILNNIGVIHKNHGNITLALEYYLEALKVQETLNDKPGMATSYFNLGSIYFSLDDLDQAQEFYLKSLKVNEEIDSKKGKANAYNNIGAIFKMRGDLAKSLEYHQKSLEIKQEIGDKAGISDSYINIGIIQETLGDIDLAFENYDQSRKICEEIKNAKGLATSYFNLANIKLSQGAIQGEDGAIAMAKESFRIAEEIGFPEAIRNASGILFRIYDSQRNYKEALEMHKLFVQMKDSVSNYEYQRASSRRQAQYEYEKQRVIDEKEHEKKIAIKIEEQKKQQILMYAAIIGFVLVAGFLFFVFNRLKATRRQKKIIEAQKKEVDKAYTELNLEKAKGEELLLNILPQEIAEELKEKGTADTKFIDNATVLFTDFKGFTDISEKLSANELVKEINICFSAFDVIMDKYKVEKIKTIGDAYMAAGGLPIPNETHALDVVRAALDIQAFMQQHNEEKRQKGEVFFEIRIGVHSGPVVAGIVGLKKFQYDIWGDTVNKANRMESSGKAGKVNISAATYELIKDHPDFIFQYRAEIEIKGKGKMQMYFVERKREWFVGV